MYERMNANLSMALALILLGGVTGCPNNDPGFKPGSDDTGDDTSDSGSTTGDTGTTMGDTGDTSVPDEDSVGGLGVALQCTLSDAHNQNTFVTDNYYDDWDGSGGTECHCPVELVSEGFIPETVRVRIEGRAFATAGDASSFDRSLCPAAGVAYKQATNEVFSASGSATTTCASFSELWHQEFLATPANGDVFGNWQARLSRIDVDGGANGCDDYLDATVTFYDAGQARVAPPDLSVSPAGTESDLDCPFGQTRTTKYRLVKIPGFVHLVPLAIGGSGNYAGSRVKSVTVTDWKTTEELRLRHAGAEVVLTPTNATASITPDDWWYGSNRWLARRITDDAIVDYPEIELTHECPASRVGETVATSQGFGSSLSQLGQAVDQATGGIGLGGWMTGAPDATIPVYALRILPASNPAQVGFTHTLRVELRGSWAAFRLPLTETATGSWSFDLDFDGLTLQGTVVQGETLGISLTSGSLTDDGGTTALQPASLTLAALGED